MGRFDIHRLFFTFGMLVLFSTLVLCGCKKKEKEPQRAEKVPDVQYETGKVTAFCVDAQGKIYTCEEGVENINVYDADGKKLSAIAVEGGTGAGSRYSVLCAGKDALYVSDSVEMGIVKIDISTGARELIYATPTQGYWNLLDMVVCNDSLFFMYRILLDYADQQMMSDIEAGYSYYGETVVCLDTGTKEAKELEVSGVKRLCKKSENEVLFFAYEQDQGFVYRVYDAKKKTYSAEYEADPELNLRWSSVMAFDDNIKRLIYPAANDGQLRAIDITKLESEIDFYNTGLSYLGTNSLQCVNGCTYFAVDGKVTKIDNSSYIKITENGPLKIMFIEPVYPSAEAMGHEVVTKKSETEEIAMKLLAGDSDYDLLFLSSNDPIAEQIRRTGAFEPLNAIEGIETYLGSCFDYIKEAATAENGAIWMLPYEIDTRLLVYQPELCKKYGVNLSGDLTYPEYIRYRDLLAELDSEEKPVFYSRLVWWTALSQYIMNYGVVNGEAQFDTQQFRTLALSLKNLDRLYGGFEKLIQDFSTAKTDEELWEVVQGYYKSYAFGDVEKRELEQKVGIRSNNIGPSFTAGLMDFDFFEVRKLPAIAEGADEKSPAYAYFYVINPNSKRKKEAMEYLADITGTLIQNESIYRTKKLTGEYSKFEKQVHEVYADAEIYFAYPEDVYGAEYLYYIKGMIDLDEMIREAQRKFTIYLKE